MLPFRLYTQLIILLMIGGAPKAFANLSINGIADLTLPGIYDAKCALYVSSPTENAAALLKSNDPIRMEYRFTGDRVSGRGFLRSLLESIAVNASDAELERFQDDLLQFTKLMRLDLNTNDRLVFDIQRRQLDILWNGADVGTIKSRGMGMIILRSWIGNVPRSTTLKHKILGGGRLDTRQLAAFDAIKPSMEQIAAAVDAKKTPAPKKRAPVSTANFAFSDPLEISDPHSVNALKRWQQTNKDDSLKPRVDVYADMPAQATELEKAYITHLRKQCAKYAYFPKHLAGSTRREKVTLRVRINQLGKAGYIDPTGDVNQIAFLNASKTACRAASPYSPMPSELEQTRFDFNVTFLYH